VFDYGMMPIEGLWWVPDMAGFSIEDKATWDWTVMTMQPSEVTGPVYTDAKVKAAKKSPLVLERVRLEAFEEGHTAQVLHRGPYSTEGSTIAAPHAFIAGQGMESNGRHHEIHLSDPNRAA
jgi:hypothetical protein